MTFKDEQIHKIPEAAITSNTKTKEHYCNVNTILILINSQEYLRQKSKIMESFNNINI